MPKKPKRLRKTKRQFLRKETSKTRMIMKRNKIPTFTKTNTKTNTKTILNLQRKGNARNPQKEKPKRQLEQV